MKREKEEAEKVFSFGEIIEIIEQETEKKVKGELFEKYIKNKRI